MTPRSHPVGAGERFVLPSSNPTTNRHTSSGLGGVSPARRGGHDDACRFAAARPDGPFGGFPGNRNDRRNEGLVRTERRPSDLRAEGDDRRDRRPQPAQGSAPRRNRLDDRLAQARADNARARSGSPAGSPALRRRRASGHPDLARRRPAPPLAEAGRSNPSWLRRARAEAAPHRLAAPRQPSPMEKGRPTATTDASQPGDARPSGIRA